MTVLAPDTFQLRVTVWPVVMFWELAVNEIISGPSACDVGLDVFCSGEQAASGMSPVIATRASTIH